MFLFMQIENEHLKALVEANPRMYHSWRTCSRNKRLNWNHFQPPTRKWKDKEAR